MALEWWQTEAPTPAPTTPSSQTSDRWTPFDVYKTAKRRGRTGIMELWRSRLAQPAPQQQRPGSYFIQQPEPYTPYVVRDLPAFEQADLGPRWHPPMSVPGREQPQALPPEAPQWAYSPDYMKKADELGAKIFPWWGARSEDDPKWMQDFNTFIEMSTRRGLARVIQAFERPEQRALLGGPPGGPEPELERVPTAFEGMRQVYGQPSYMGEFFRGEQIAPTVDPEEYRVLLDWKAREEAIAEKKAELPAWLADPYGVDPLGIGQMIAELQVGVPATLKAWEAITYRAPALRQVERVGAVGFQLLQEPAFGLEETTGAVSIMTRPESKDLTVEQWYPLTTRTWSLAYWQLKGNIEQRRDYPGTRLQTDILGESLTAIGNGTATAEDIALAREVLGAELVGQLLADPLNLIDWLLAANKVARAKALTAAQVKMLNAAADSPDAIKTLAALEKGFTDVGMLDVFRLQQDAQRAGITLDPTTLDKVRDIATKPFQLTPDAKALRDLNEITLALTPVLEMSKSGREALQLLKLWADEPAALAPILGRVPQSLAGEKAGIVLRVINEVLPDLPSFKARPFNAARAWVDVDQLALQALRVTHGYEEPGRVAAFFSAYKRLMGEFYLNAATSPGYVVRNFTGDTSGMLVDGLLTFDHADDIEAYFGKFGEFSTRRLMTEGAAGREALAGTGEIKSIFPGIIGKYSEAGQRVTRFAEPLGRLPLGEESRYKRAVYVALKRFWEQNAPQLLPDMPEIVIRRFGDQAKHLRFRIAHEPDLNERQAIVTRFLDSKKGAQFEPTVYLDPEDLDAMSPAMLKKIRDELADLEDGASTRDVQKALQRVRDAIDEDEARRLAEMEDLPARVHVTTDVDEAETADEMIDDLEEAVRITGDKDLADEVEEIKAKVPEVEQELDDARAAALDDLEAEPNPDGLEILVRANTDAESIRDEWRLTNDKLRQETVAAYRENPMRADELWTDYVRKVNQNWMEKATERIERFQLARDELARLRAGESLDDILGEVSRQSRAEDWMRKASEVPDRPKGYMPGRVLDAGEDDSFEAFLDWRRKRLDSYRTNAWRAVYGTEPEDYGRVLDLLDSADRDVEQFGKATAGKIRELYKDTRAKEAKIKNRRFRSKAAREQALDAVWERYYILRNDYWTKFWEAAEQRWKIAERDVLWSNWSKGPRMEPPAGPRKPPPTEPPEQPTLPRPGEDQPEPPPAAPEPEPPGRPQPGDEDLVRAAARKTDAEWTPEERAAIERWTSEGNEIPEPEPSLIKAADIPPYTRSDLKRDLKGIKGWSDQQADDMIQLYDSAANAWSKATGKPPEDWYSKYIVGHYRGDTPNFELFQRAPNTESAEFAEWFGRSAASDLGDPLVLYHGTPSAGFTTFDMGHADPNALYGPGIYGTDAADVGGGYSKGEGTFRFLDDVENLEPKIQEAALKAEHPEVRKAREAQDAAYQEWYAYVEANPEAGVDEGLLAIERRIDELTTRRRAKEAMYGYSGVDREWGDMLRRRIDDPAGCSRMLQRYNIDPAGIVEQTGAPGVYPVYMSIQNPFDMAGRYTAEEFLEITGRPAPWPAQTYSGEEVYQTLRNRGYLQHSGEGPKTWANAELARKGYDGISYTGGKVTGGKRHRAFVAFQPEQVKSIWNKGDWSQSSHLLYQGSPRAPRWYYKAERVVDAKMPAQAGIEQIRGILGKGIKKDELRWNGVLRWLDDQESWLESFADAPGGRYAIEPRETLAGTEVYRVTRDGENMQTFSHRHQAENYIAHSQGKLTKQEVMAYLQEHRVEVEELLAQSNKPRVLSEWLRTQGMTPEQFEDLDALTRVELEAEYRQWREAPQIYGPVLDAEAHIEDLGYTVNWEPVGGPHGDNYAPASLTASDGEVYYYENLEHEPRTQRAFDNLIDEHNKAVTNAPQYEQWTLRGGENYKELRLRFAGSGLHNELPEGYYLKRGIGSRYEVHGPGFGRYASGRTEQEAISAFHRQHPQETGGAFYSTHFDEPNIIAHVRMTDRYTPEGRRFLFIEEIQSDWHQTARKRRVAEIERRAKSRGIKKGSELYREIQREVPKDWGYKQQDAIEVAEEEVRVAEAEWARLRKEYTAYVNDLGTQIPDDVLPLRAADEENFGNLKVEAARYGHGILSGSPMWADRQGMQRAAEFLSYDQAVEVTDRVHEVHEAGRLAQQAKDRLRTIKLQDKGKIPAGPFADTWDELSLKRMYRWAAENDYDGIAWTTGAQQWDRYNLGAFVDRIEYHPSNGKLYGYDGKQTVFEYIVDDPADLDEWVGAERAEMLRSRERAIELEWTEYPPREGVEWERGWSWNKGQMQVGEWRDGSAYVIRNNRTIEFDTLDEAWEEVTRFAPRSIEGDDLAVGDLGLKEFYDRILPWSSDNLTKRWQVKSGEVTFPLPSRDIMEEGFTVQGYLNESGQQIGYYVMHEGERYAGPFRTHIEAAREIPRITEEATAHGFLLPEGMRRDLLDEGLPMFQRAEQPRLPGLETPAAEIRARQIQQSEMRYNRAREQMQSWIYRNATLTDEETRQVLDFIVQGKYDQAEVTKALGPPRWMTEQAEEGARAEGWVLADELRHSSNDYATQALELDRFGRAEDTGRVQYPTRRRAPGARTARQESRLDELKRKGALTPEEDLEFLELQDRPRYMLQAQRHGAKGAFDVAEDGRAIITFFEGADISTGVHEFGHLLRRTLPTHELELVEKWAGLRAGDFERLRPVWREHRRLSEMATRTADQTDRMDAIAGQAKKYEDAEELWARGFERYMAEGKAPSAELEGVFGRMKNWLLDIYQQIVGSSLDVKLTDEIRGVMDRLLVEQPLPRTNFTDGIQGGITKGWADPVRKYEFRYRLVNMDDVVASHTQALQPNPGYPGWLQPRMRSRADSAAQVDRIARQLDPEELISRTTNLDSGPIIVGPDGLVESGNGRYLAIQRAAEAHPDRYKGYVDYLRENMEAFGLTADDLEGVNNPILVRERITKVDRTAFAKEANEARSMRMGAVETAAADVGRISDEMLASLDVTDTEGIDQALRAAKNREIVRAFMDALPPEEAAALRGAGGELAQAGLQRIKSALLASTYQGDAGTRLVAAMTEAVDPVVKNVENAIYGSLPQVARSEAATRSGARAAELSISDDIAAAVDVLARLKREGPKVEEYLAQIGMFGAELTPEQLALLRFFETNKRSAKKIREFMQGYAAEVMAQAAPSQAALFGDFQRSSKADLMGVVGKKLGFDDLIIEGPGGAPPGAPLMQAAEGGYTHVDDAIRRAMEEAPKPISQTQAMRIRTDLTEQLLDLDAEIGTAFHQQNDVGINRRLQELVNSAENQRRYGVPDAELDRKLATLSGWFDLPEADFAKQPAFRPPEEAGPLFGGEAPTMTRGEAFGPPQVLDEPELPGMAPEPEQPRFAAPEPEGPALPGMELDAEEPGKFAGRWTGTPPRPTLEQTPNRGFYVTNAEGLGGRSFPPGTKGKRAAQGYHAEQARIWDEANAEPGRVGFGTRPEEARDAFLPGMEPAMGDKAKYAARPVGEELPPAPEGQMGLFDQPPAEPPTPPVEQPKFAAPKPGKPPDRGPGKWEPARLRMDHTGRIVRESNLRIGMDVWTADGRLGKLNTWGTENAGVILGDTVKEYPLRDLQVHVTKEWDELRPKRKPKGQATLWQSNEAEQMGFWREDPDNWREYMKALNEPGASPGPLPPDLLDKSTQATRRAVDKIEQGILGEWDQWRAVPADQEAKRALADWFTNEVRPSWYEQRAVAFEYATQQADFALLDYAKRRNWDVWLSYVFPYHYWFTRAGKNWAKRLARRPGMLGSYIRVRDAMKLANERAGRRQRFEGKFRVPAAWLPGWMGDALYVDPMKMIAPFANIFGTNWDDADDSATGLRKIYNTAQQFGLRPYHIWDYLYQSGALQKAGELIGIAPGPAQQLLGPQYAGNFPYILPQTGLIKAGTAALGQMGADWVPPGGVNIEAPLRRLLPGVPAGEIWDPYRVNRMLANLAAERKHDMGYAQVVLRAQALVEADKEQQTGQVWSPDSALAQEVAAQWGWTPQQLQQAQEVLAEAMQKAALERGIGTLGWLTGPQVAIEPRGERAQLEMAEEAGETVWTPEQPWGSREAYNQFKAEHPAMYPRATQYATLPGEQDYNSMPPGARANWLILDHQKEMLHTDYDEAVDQVLRESIWNWDARNDLEDQRRLALAELDEKYPMPEMTQDLPAILYGMNPAEMWDGTVEKELYRLQNDKPDPSDYEIEGEGVDWDSYYRDEERWRAGLPKMFSFGSAKGGLYDRLDPRTAMQNFEQRYDSPLEAAHKVYTREIASPAWDAYNKEKEVEDQLFPGARELQSQYFTLDQGGRRALLRANPVLGQFWDYKDRYGSAYERTVGKVESVPAVAIIPAILANYQTKDWTEESLRAELSGVVFPSLDEQQDLKRAWRGEESYDSSSSSGGGYGSLYSGGRSYGSGGGYSSSRWSPRRYTSGGSWQYPRWRPPATFRGGPFRG